MKKHPEFPIYIPSKGRYGRSETARMFDRYGTPYRVVVEPQEVDNYAKVVGKERLVVLPKNDQGLVYARNFCKQHSIDEGHERHWQFDDDIRQMGRMYRRDRIQCDSSIAIVAAEQFIQRYENVGLCAFNHIGFLPPMAKCAPFHLNTRCYTCFCMWNKLPNTWRYRYNEDTDMSLQVIAAGYCTIMFNAFFMQTCDTNYGGKESKVEGGQQAVYADDGRLKMSRDLERQWPRVVTTTRKFGRPQHKVASNWAKFDTKLIRRKDIDWENMQAIDELGMTLTDVDKIKHPEVQKTLDAYKESHG